MGVFFKLGTNSFGGKIKPEVKQGYLKSFVNPLTVDIQNNVPHQYQEEMDQKKFSNSVTASLGSHLYDLG